MPLARNYDFHCDAGADWHRQVRLRAGVTGDLVPLEKAMLDIRNTNFVLALRLDQRNGRCVVLEDGATIQLYLSADETEHYFRSGNYPGAVQAVGFWGIGRSYMYDLFVWYEGGTMRSRAMRGFFYVDPNITRPNDPDNLPTIPIGRRGSHV